MKTKLQLIRTMLIISAVSFLFTIGCKKDSSTSTSSTNSNTNCSCKDNEGNCYKIVTIGAQTWMAENLKTKHYNNGDAMGTTSTATLDISDESNPKYQWAYNGNESNVSTYGRLYTWYAITDSRGVCPAGYHIPTDAEWAVLTAYLVDSLAGGKMKEAGITHWQSPNTGANNSSGFTALPAGNRGGDGSFLYLGNGATFWSSTEHDAGTAWARDLYNNNDRVYRGYSYLEEVGMSVRCLKD